MPITTGVDTDATRVGDELENQISTLHTAISRARSAQEKDALARRLLDPVPVELVFDEQITQAQLDTFVAMGGVVDHVYEAVAYGWNGTVAIGAVEDLASALGPSLLLIAGDRPIAPTLNEATRTGRARQVWSGVASVPGLDGNANTTIGIIDSGIDESHTDLAGRQQFWQDFTSEGDVTPRDVFQHGSHVAGIALGTGAAHGSGVTTLRYTDSGNLSGVTAGLGFVSPVHIAPAPAMTYAHTAAWLGGGSTDLGGTFQLDNNGGPLTFITAPTFGASGVTESNFLVPSVSSHYSAFLAQSAGGSITNYAIRNTATSFPTPGDGFNVLSGVAPGTRWAGAKVFTASGTGMGGWTGTAVDTLVANRVANNIKVINMSLGTIGAPGIDPTLRAKVNTAVNNGIVVVASAGNDGPGTAGANLVDDPGRASLVLTVGAANDLNQLTNYTSSGFTSPGADEDLKPDVLAPGGSDFFSHILSVDSNDNDGQTASLADQQANDYYNIKGTSMAAPFAAGAAALVIDALESQTALSWSFASSQHPLLVKMLLGASASETNATREVASGSNPTLGRSTTPKDRFEGYGLINPDAAVEAVAEPANLGGPALCIVGSNQTTSQRSWGRHLDVVVGTQVSASLSNPGSGDFDLYLYSETPDAKGNPVIVSASTSAGNGVAEAANYTSTVAERVYLFVKRVSGSGMWCLSGTVIAPPTTTTTTSTTTTTTSTTLPSGLCGAAPNMGCLIAGKSTALVKDNGDPSKAQIKWKWLKGAATVIGDFGDPITSHDYRFCVWDASASVPTKVVDASVLPSALWKAISSKGFKYKDNAGTNDGVTGMKVQIGVAGKSKAQLKAKGVNLLLPGAFSGAEYFDSDPSVVMQLTNPLGTCWTSDLTVIKKNSATLYKALE